MSSLNYDSSGPFRDLKWDGTFFGKGRVMCFAGADEKFVAEVVSRMRSRRLFLQLKKQSANLLGGKMPQVNAEMRQADDEKAVSVTVTNHDRADWAKLFLAALQWNVETIRLTVQEKMTGVEQLVTKFESGVVSQLASDDEVETALHILVFQLGSAVADKKSLSTLFAETVELTKVFHKTVIAKLLGPTEGNNQSPASSAV